MRTRRSRNTHRRWMILLAVSYLLAVSAHAEGASRRGRHAVSRKSRPKLQIGPGLSANNLFALKVAYKFAIKRVAGAGSCRALFDELDLDGPQALGSVHYQSAQSAPDRARCGPGVSASTGVGRARVILCRHFHTLPQRTKIAILIHEALHTAGLNEAPHDPTGLTSREITAMVEEACSL